MLLKIKYSVLGIILILVVAFRLKLEGDLNDFGLIYKEDAGLKMEYLGLQFEGYYGSMTLFFILCVLFLVLLYDYLSGIVSDKFFTIALFIFSFSLFAFEESFIRLLAIIVIGILFRANNLFEFKKMEK